MNLIRKLVADRRVLIAIYIFFALAATTQAVLLSHKRAAASGEVHISGYSNYTIFERSFHHLVNHQDLYAAYPKEHWDLYKYTPTFSVFFGFFGLFPDWLGLGLWNLLNALLLLFAIYLLPKIEPVQKGLILLIILIELMTSMQNSQSNGLIAGLLVLSFALLEKKHISAAAFCIVFSAYIKLFGITALLLFPLYPGKKKLVLHTIFWALILFLVPLVFTGFREYIDQLKSYGNLLLNDHDSSYGYSVMGLMKSWFGVDGGKNLVVAAGAIVLIIPLLSPSRYRIFEFRILMLASLLVWMVIFNHKAESPTFVIAITGVAIWFTSSWKDPVSISLFILAIILTVLSPTDLFPRTLREGYVKPYVLKALPCILIWFRIIYEMIRIKENEVRGRKRTGDSVPL